MYLKSINREKKACKWANNQNRHFSNEDTQKVSEYVEKFPSTSFVSAKGLFPTFPQGRKEKGKPAKCCMKLIFTESLILSVMRKPPWHIQLWKDRPLNSITMATSEFQEGGIQATAHQSLNYIWSFLPESSCLPSHLCKHTLRAPSWGPTVWLSG